MTQRSPGQYQNPETTLGDSLEIASEAWQLLQESFGMSLLCRVPSISLMDYVFPTFELE